MNKTNTLESANKCMTNKIKFLKKCSDIREENVDEGEHVK